jgi:hypothetical protein
VFAYIGHAMHVIAGFIQGIGMHIDLAAMSVGEDEVTFPGAVARLFTIATESKELTQPRNVPVRQGDIEVLMGPGLFAQQSVHSPATIDVDLQAVLLQKPNEFGGVAGIHGS